MTREEALAQLRNGPGINEDVSEEYNEAVDMAIKALEQESCNTPRNDLATTSQDCISRQAVLNTLFYKSDNNCEVVLNKELQDRIKALPHVTPTQKWIPVSERLPEKGGDYLVTTEWKGSYSGDVYTETNMAVYREKEEEWDCAGIVAWMPLPEPYEPTN